MNTPMKIKWSRIVLTMLAGALLSLNISDQRLWHLITGSTGKQIQGPVFLFIICGPTKNSVAIHNGERSSKRGAVITTIEKPTKRY